MGIHNVDLNNINLDNNFDESDPDTIILIRFLAWHIKFEKCKALNKMISEELIAIAWHPNRWWDRRLPEDEIKEIDRLLLSNAFNVYNMRVLCEYLVT